ncbi:MAG: DUF2726 domain-containing protein [Verrucomicrobiales bacterium]|nr:DUF2726 domain-containing protein [Verrucomicrobiales bacterium]
MSIHPIFDHFSSVFGLVALGLVVWVVLKMILAGGMSGRGVSYPYQAIPCLFTPAEQLFLGVLQQAVDPEYQIFGKVRVADLMSVVPGMDRSERQKAFNRIQSKHIDFVICRAADSEIFLLIELDDRSHNQPQRVERDDFVNRAAEAAGLPLLRIPCRRSYSVEEVSILVASHLPKTGRRER